MTERSAKRADFLDPDFGVKASFNLPRRNGGKCRLGAEADSEIPELGLDSGRLNVDCDLNPVQMVGAAYKAAKDYGQYRQSRRYQPQSSRIVKRKRTQINIDREYERAKVPGNDDDDEEADDGPNNNQANGHHGQAAPVDEQSSAIDQSGEADDDDDD